ATLELRQPDGSPVCADTVQLSVINTLGPMGLECYPQHKDTTMLSIPLPTDKWNKPHPPSCSCGLCKIYCARASLQMINHYYGGNLTQDYISYARGRTVLDWPKNNQLGANEGWKRYDEHGAADLSWALAGAATVEYEGENEEGYEKLDIRWNQMVHSLMRYHPLLHFDFNHSLVVFGVNVFSDKTYAVGVLDPGVDDYEDRVKWKIHASFFGGIYPDWVYGAHTNRSATQVHGRTNQQQGLGIDTDHDGSVDTPESAYDQDGDGICDWDERNRWFAFIDHTWPYDNFILDPHDSDTDGDGTDDMQDLIDELKREGYK
ncbi:MAG: hypothetical protein ACLFWL_17940, partial [Candidatus Brocadiia bacterium]